MSPGSAVMLVRIDSTCGTLRIENLWVGSANGVPGSSTFSRIPPSSSDGSLSSSVRAVLVLKTNSGSLCGSVLMNGPSIV